MCAGRVVWGLCPSLQPRLPCGNNLDRAWGIFNNWSHIDVYITSLVGGFNSCVCVITRRCWGIGGQVWSIACGGYWLRCCAWFWGVCFLRKWWFLRVTLSDLYYIYICIYYIDMCMYIPMLYIYIYIYTYYIHTSSSPCW